MLFFPYKGQVWPGVIFRCGDKGLYSAGENICILRRRPRVNKRKKREMNNDPKKISYTCWTQDIENLMGNQVY